MAIKEIEVGSPYYIPMAVPFAGVADEPIRALTPANNNLDVLITGGLTDLKQAQVQFSLQAGRTPALWSQEKAPILSLLDYVDGVPSELWPKPFTLRHAKRIEGQFTNTGAEQAGTVVFVCDQKNEITSTTIQADLSTLGDMLTVAIDSGFTNEAGEEPQRAYSAPMNWDFLLYGFYSELSRASVQIRDIDGKEWMGGWTPIWAVAGREDFAVKRRMLRRPYLIPAQKSLGVNFQNDSVPEASGKLWLYGQKLQRVG